MNDIALTLSLSDVKDFIELYGCELDTQLFVECIFAIDNDYIAENRKKPSK